MLKLTRFEDNPVLLPSLQNEWESAGAFNGTVTKCDDKYLMLYRALTPRKFYINTRLEVSTIGSAISKDGFTFSDHSQFIKPEEDWEKYGCEDPRITKLEDKYFICYTALSDFPFSSANIKVAVAISKDGKTIDERHLVTPFNAKAMALFPEKIDGKYAAILTANTDLPPSKIGIALFDSLDELWSENYWKSWYVALDEHTIPLLKDKNDQVEVGAVPIKTKDGWLLIYSYIKNYYSEQKEFGIEAVLLDLKNPQKVLKRTEESLLEPKENYELYGNISHVIFPSGAVIKDDKLLVYYGAADTSCCIAWCKLDQLLEEMVPVSTPSSKDARSLFERFDENPILLPVPEHHWESKAVYNPTAIFEEGKIHILYRAQSADDTSTVGYATSSDGLHIDERLPYPIYVPRMDFEAKKAPGNSGCEDARIVRIEDRYYICYTAFDSGVHPPQVAMSSIKVKDFLNRDWNWEIPVLISPPGVDDKDASLFPKKIGGKYVFFHRINGNIWIDYRDKLEFGEGNYLAGEILMEPNKDSWDNHKIGIAGPPIETEKGWLLLYHGVEGFDDRVYKVGAVLLDLNHPSNVINWLNYPLFEPETRWEKEGQIPNVVFPCGQAIVNDTLFLYYGGADSVVGVAKAKLSEILNLFS